MTLTDLARAWLDRNTFDSPKDLKARFLFFNKDIDNIDEFIEKFEDLAELNKFPEGHKLEAFKITMPREIELHLKSITNLQDCYQTAKDLLTIVQNPITNKMSTLSLAQS